MKRLRGFFIFLVFILAIIAIISLLLPSKVTIAKSVDINASPEKITSQITDFEQWKNWYPAFSDENITVTNNTPGAHSVTLTDRNGKKMILNITEAKPQMINVQVQSSSSAKVNYRFILTPKINNQTQLTWDINTEMKWYPWKKIQGIFLDKISGNQYQTALENLKKAAEN